MLVASQDRNHAHGDEIEKDIPFLKAYTVICVDQIDGLPDLIMRRSPR